MQPCNPGRMKADAAIAELETDLEKTKASLSRIREKSSRVADATANTVATVGGGAVGGWMASTYKGKSILGLKAETALGGAATAIGLFGYAGKNSEIVASFGEGVLAFDVGMRVYESTEKKKQGGTTAAAPANKPAGVAGEVGALPPTGGLITLQQLYDQARAMQGQGR